MTAWGWNRGSLSDGGGVGAPFVVTGIPAGWFAALRKPQGAVFSVFEGSIDD